MMTRDADKKREQMLLFCMDDMVPQDHMLCKVDKAINWNFIYDLVIDRYCHDNGRPSLDPVILIKLVFIQYLYGIKSMRQTIKEIEVNVAYRWFLGLDMLDPIPHFSTFGKNYTRRFKDTDLFEQIFSHILKQCMKFHLIDTSVIFIDSTHVKACANGKKPFKEKDDNDRNPPSSDGGSAKGATSEKKQKCSTTDPDSGWFHNGEHKQVFAYGIQTICDRNGWILGYTYILATCMIPEPL